jgi:hypothetical protein
MGERYRFLVVRWDGYGRVMRPGIKMAAAVGVAGLGFVAAMALAAGGSANVRACAVKRTGEIRSADTKGRCGSGEFAITISGDAFHKSSKGGTLTINGVSFARKGKTLTINGTSFRSRGKTLTINGTSFRSGGNTLTINGTEFTKGVAPAGPTGPQGKIGPTGPPGIPYGPPPVDVTGPISATSGGDPVTLASVTHSHSDGVAHRLLFTGGFNAVCNPCSPEARTAFSLVQDGTPVVNRQLAMPDSPTAATGGVVSETVVTPTACGPCTYALAMRVTGGTGSVPKVDATAIRLGVLDLGPVGG